MKYFRIHTAEKAYLTKQPRGIFTAVWKLVESGILNEEEIKEYWRNREYFEKVLFSDDMEEIARFLNE